MNETSSDEDTEDITSAEPNEDGAAANSVAANEIEQVGAINVSTEFLVIEADPLNEVNDAVAILEIEGADESIVTGQLIEMKTDSPNGGDAAIANEQHDEKSVEQKKDDSVIFVDEFAAGGVAENESLASLHVEPVGHLVKFEEDPRRDAVQNEQEDATLWGFHEYFEDDEPNSA